VDSNLNRLIQDSHFFGSGWSFPVTFSAWNHQLDITSGEENVNNAIRIILLTNRGERSLEQQFGSGLQPFFFRQMDESLKGEIKDAVKFALLQNEPRITVENVVVEFADRLSGLINIKIVYQLNQSNTRHNYVFPFYLKEGTNLHRHQ
jgi:phage baseplate assembly protein W